MELCFKRSSLTQNCLNFLKKRNLVRKPLSNRAYGTHTNRSKEHNFVSGTIDNDVSCKTIVYKLTLNKDC